ADAAGQGPGRWRTRESDRSGVAGQLDMTEWAASLLVRYLSVPEEHAKNALHVAGIIGAALTFVMMSTLIVASDSLMIAGQDAGSLRVGAVPTRNILAPRGVTYESEVLTERLRQETAANVADVYDPP